MWRGLYAASLRSSAAPARDDFVARKLARHPRWPRHGGRQPIAVFQDRTIIFRSNQFRRKPRQMQHTPEPVRAAHKVFAGYRRRPRRIDAAKHDGKILGKNVGECLDQTQDRFSCTTLRQKRCRLSRPPTVELNVVVSQISMRPAKHVSFRLQQGVEVISFVREGMRRCFEINRLPRQDIQFRRAIAQTFRIAADDNAG